MILHILNGDSTKYIFQKANIEGDIVVWREVFCQGLVNYPMSNNDLWKLREKELIRLYGISSEDYKTKTIDEINKINSDYNEINLWFEFDFYCQINMIASLSYIYNNIDDIEKISCNLICVGKELINERMSTLSDYKAENYKELYRQKRVLTRFDFEYANLLFERFTSDNPNDFYTSLKNTKTFDFFDLLKKSYCKLFIEEDRHLSLLDQIIFDSFNMNHTKLKHLILDILEKTSDFGFGDSQVMTMIKSFQKNILSLNPPRLISPLIRNLSEDFIGHVDRRKWFFKPEKQKFFSFKK